MVETVHARRRWRRRWLLLLIPVLAVAGWFAVSAASYAVSLRFYMIPSASMKPTLAPGDRVAVETGRRQLPRRGEVWVFTSPGGQTFVKRVIGLPGETVSVEAGRVKIGGTPLEEPYLAAPMTYEMAPRTLKAGQYFMLGDSRNASSDSHNWGPVPENQFIGRVGYRYWPKRRMGSLDR